MTVPYREETPPGWPEAVERTWAVEQIAGGVRLSGDCPTCGHPTETRVVTVIMAPGARPDPRWTPPTGPEPVLVVCDCVQDHEGRPAGRTGCGRAAYLELLADQP
ncbi:hypothetical protein [Actinoplanes siamensis]|uniref:Uncharacterized protein n=1 Tax=Actinoplanes siamensis TaxID=1223317 RepID=A0A919N484_9ACTN|nr:hypothetical protein [Actinoplanes siamensis]GIF04091.1 hypothetical protein Asi03nite_16290 [Actinoplanes siamensis]